MISVVKLNEILSDDIESITTILENLNVENIKVRQNEIRFSYEEGSNPTGCKINTETLSYYSFSRSEKGNIYTLIMDKLGFNFPQTLEWVAKILSLEKSSLNGTIILPFGGFYKHIGSNVLSEGVELPIYSDEVLKEYLNKYNLMFLKDGISYKTQQKFNVGYDLISNRITIPEYDVQGNLIGVMGRLNSLDCPKENRWLPLIPCQRNQTLYGFHINYADIIRKDICIVGESEKFVMQLDSMGLHIGLATGTNTISKAQVDYIKSLRVNTIILAYDEGLDEELLRKEVEKLKSDNILYQNKVGYIYDRENKVLPKGSKASPSDLGEDSLKELIKNHVVWI